MIRLLEGTIYSTESDALVVVVGGVGYQVFTPHAGSFAVGSNVVLHTHHAVRETALDLFGFATVTELLLFELLLKVPKIGPRSALQVMTQASPQLLIDAISRGDAGYLQKLSGIGKKTCENIMTQLHGKLPPELEMAAIQTGAGGLTPAQADAIDALIALGYVPDAARSAVQTLTTETDELTTNQIVTLALKQIQ
ncbi:Holliday junction branch migration protein RuvA [Candidatus Kaiserbacteria bacterium]|nr:Holliday junction branch migration protein RuvA [Candidatus Kaiserbacteria bacterium]